MRRLGVLAAALVACVAVGAGFSALDGRASAAGPPPAPGARRLPKNLEISLVISRGHEIMTVSVRNRGPGPVCIDPNYPATARLAAYAKNGQPIASLNPSQGHPKIECVRLPMQRTVRAVYDLRSTYPLGLPGDSRLCYASWWKLGGPGSKATVMTTTHCLRLPEQGIGRR